MDKGQEPLERCVTQTDLTLHVDESNDQSDDEEEKTEAINEYKDMTIEERNTKKVHLFSGYL